jgi:hypothetical protein
LKSFLSDWRNSLPVAGLGVVVVTGLYYFMRPKRVDPDAMERERRSYLNRVGRIVEGQVVDVRDESSFLSPEAGQLVSQLPEAKKIELSSAPAAKAPLKKSFDPKTVSVLENPSAASGHGIPRLLYYSYSISGVTYETAQDITGLEERVHLSRIASGQTASVKYDPSNPSNSILLADDWSGLH